MKTFQFRDGLKEIKVGKTVFLMNSNRRNQGLKKDTIVKIGRTLIHLESGLSFYIETGMERSEYCRNQIYSCTLAFDHEKLKKKWQKKIYQMANVFTFEQCKAIMELTGMEL